MSNIPLPSMPDVKSATGFQQIDPSTGTAPFRAMMDVGNAIGDLGNTFYAIGEKKQKLDNAAAKADLQTQIMRANSDIDDFAARNPNDAEGLRSFSANRMSKVMDSVDKTKVDEETALMLDNEFKLQATRTAATVRGKATALEIGNANAKLMNQALMFRRAGQPQQAFDTMREMQITDEQLYENMHEIFSEGVDFDVREEIRAAYENRDVAGLEEIQEKLEEKTFGDAKYANWEYEVEMNGKTVSAGGLGKSRKQRIDEVRSKIAKLETAAVRGYQRAMRSYYSTGVMPPMDPNMPVTTREMLEDLQDSDSGTLGIQSTEYEGIEDEIGKEIVAYDEEGYDGMSEAERKELWEKIVDGNFSMSAKVNLASSFMRAEQARASRDDVAGKGFLTWFYDPKVPQEQQAVLESMVGRYQNLTELMKLGGTKELNPKAVLTFMDAMEELEEKVKTMKPEEQENYIKVVVPELFNEKMSGYIQTTLDKSLIYNAE